MTAGHNELAKGRAWPIYVLVDVVPRPMRKRNDVVRRGHMKTGDTVTDLGLYDSECCSAELIFDTGDRFVNCPTCNRACTWELEEELVMQDEFERVNGVAA